MHKITLLRKYVNESLLHENVSALDIVSLLAPPSQDEEHEDISDIGYEIDDRQAHVEDDEQEPAFGRHFTLKDMQVSGTAKKHGLDNTPTDSAQAALDDLLRNIINPLKDRVSDLRISSAYRSPEVNRRVGGAAKSQHMSGEAADISAPSMRAEGLASLIVDMGLPFDQLIWYDEGRGGHVHVSYTTRRENSGKTLHAPDRGGYENWTPKTAAGLMNESLEDPDKLPKPDIIRGPLLEVYWPGAYGYGEHTAWTRNFESIKPDIQRAMSIFSSDTSKRVSIVGPFIHDQVPLENAFYRTTIEECTPAAYELWTLYGKRYPSSAEVAAAPKSVYMLVTCDFSFKVDDERSVNRKFTSLKDGNVASTFHLHEPGSAASTRTNVSIAYSTLFRSICNLFEPWAGNDAYPLIKRYWDEHLREKLG